VRWDDSGWLGARVSVRYFAMAIGEAARIRAAAG